MHTDSARPIRSWLWILWAAIVLMVALGGITRLTGSGLSIVEWEPLMGAIPPLNEADWMEVFRKYQDSPQYKLVNDHFTLAEFKMIFLWEYLHRLWGRTLGLIFAIPFLVFWWRKQLQPYGLKRFAFTFAMGGLQGLAGWLMVASGLVDRPNVSHLRLTIHFMLAVALAGWIMWLIASIEPSDDQSRAEASSDRQPGLALGLLTVTLTVQLIYGALMAGLKAGYLFPTYPDMGGSWLPEGLWAGTGLLDNWLNNPTLVHWFHRYFAFVPLALALWSWATLRAHPGMRMLSLWLTILAVLQTALGALTVLTHVSLHPAVTHQVVGFVWMSLAIYTWARWRFNSARRA